MEKQITNDVILTQKYYENKEDGNTYGFCGIEIKTAEGYVGLSVNDKTTDKRFKKAFNAFARQLGFEIGKINKEENK